MLKKSNFHKALGLGISLLGISLASQSYAKQFVVDTTEDKTHMMACTDENVVDCSLRDAIIEANKSAEDDVIFVPASDTSYKLTIAGINEEAAAKGDLDINKETGSLTIQGEGIDATIIDANAIDRIFDLKANALIIKDLNLINGSVENANGGAILTAAGSTALTLENVYLNTNVVETDGDGGAIYFAGSEGLSISGSTFFKNSASNGDGGAIVAKTAGGISILNSTFDENSCSGAGGAAALISNNVAIEASEIKNNDFGNAALFINYESQASVTIKNTVVDTNNAVSGAGGILVQAIEKGNGTVTISGSTITKNGSGNGADGGGVYLEANENTTLDASISTSTIAENQATKNGGGIFFNATSLKIDSSTIAANTATEDGAGLYHSVGTLNVLNSTFSGNTATDQGGAIVIVEASGVASLTHVTIVNNTAVDAALTSDTTGTMSHVLFNKNTAADCAFTTELTSEGNNISGNDSCFDGSKAGDQINVADALFGPLADNGGTTQTHALLAGSPAIDGGLNNADVNVDQRGVARPSGAARDIGAYEFVENLCGNGEVNDDEECDDGNDSNNDACLNTCVAAICGDGFVNEGVEECDGGINCTADCTLIIADNIEGSGCSLNANGPRSALMIALLGMLFLVPLSIKKFRKN